MAISHMFMNRLGTDIKQILVQITEIADADFAQTLEVSTDLLDKIKLWSIILRQFRSSNKIAAATGYDMDFLTGAQSYFCSDGICRHWRAEN